MRQRKPPSPREIRNAALAAGRMLNGAYVDHRPLSAARRCALWGLLFPEATGVVRQVARVLTDHAALFPRAPLPGPQLLHLQQTAEAWNGLRLVLLYLLVFASDQYLETQGEAITAALDVVRRFQGEAELPGAEGDPDLRARGVALLQVLHTLERRNRRNLQNRAPRKGRPRKEPPIDFDALFAALLDELRRQPTP